MSENHPVSARRSFLARLVTGSAALGTTFAAVSTAEAQTAGGESGAWRPARHAEDEWLEKIPGRHRLFIDTITPDGLGLALRFASNYFAANKNSYDLEAADLAVVMCVRHRSTGFACTDAMWAKYGGPLSERAEFKDPKTQQPATVNLFTASGYGPLLTNNGVLLPTLIKSGVHLAVCRMATEANANLIAQRTGGKSADIYQELVANLLPNAHMVPAGIVAVNRAQERGYAFSFGG